MTTIAVEAGLTPVRELLVREGYRTVDLRSGLGDVDAIVITGGDQNIAGVQELETKAPVINAAGRRPEEILAEIRSRLP